MFKNYICAIIWGLIQLMLYCKIIMKGEIMKNTKVHPYLIALIKLFYIILIALSLYLLKLCIDNSASGNEYFSYSLIDKFCNDLIVLDFFITGSSLVFIGFFWFLCKMSEIFCSFSTCPSPPYHLPVTRFTGKWVKINYIYTDSSYNVVLTHEKSRK